MTRGKSPDGSPSISELRCRFGAMEMNPARESPHPGRVVVGSGSGEAAGWHQSNSGYIASG